ncbi:MAG: hypothetical protein WCQ99_03680 [Pseudomonadota bacterium]
MIEFEFCIAPSQHYGVGWYLTNYIVQRLIVFRLASSTVILTPQHMGNIFLSIKPTHSCHDLDSEYCNFPSSIAMVSTGCLYITLTLNPDEIKFRVLEHSHHVRVLQHVTKELIGDTGRLFSRSSLE